VGNGHGGPVLRVDDLWVELDRGDAVVEVLHGVSLEIPAGERVALMGRNGAGKSTLLRTVAGLTTAVRGKLEVPRDVALLSQSPGDFLVRERVADEFRDPQAARESLAAVGLEAKAEADPHDLSGGERQRLALAIVMAGRANGEVPGLVCLDEPTRGMDRARKLELRGLIDHLASAGSAVVVATHDVEFAAEFADRVVLLGDGEVIADGSCSEILSGGWYFATEVARILGTDGAITPEQGAEILRARATTPAEAPR
jgi:energy-coupling factor transport system ATP-binding protein